MTTKIAPISQAEMARQLERLKDHKVECRYTRSDIAFLTGWTEKYICDLEKKRLIPKAKMVGAPRGNPKFGQGGIHIWDDDQARVILGFRLNQGKKYPWLNGGS
jgi:hypothetical protein